MTTAERPATRTKKPTFQWGAVKGRIELSNAVLLRANQCAAACFKVAELEDFSGDPVQDILTPGWLPKLHTWFPRDVVRALGFELNPKAQLQVLFTVGVDAHEDCIHGPVLILVLANDGLTFIQGRQRHCTAAGEWFIFDDRKPHEVRENAASTVYLCLSVPLQPLGA